MSRLALGGLLLLWALAQGLYRPEVELLRKDKRVVASVSGEEGSLFFAEYGEILLGPLEALTPEEARVGGRAFFRDPASRVEEGLEVGAQVEVAYNPDWREGDRPHLLRLRRAQGEPQGRYLRLVLADPKGVEVRLGEGVEARGPLGVVERGGGEEILLTGGEARYLEEEGRVELAPRLGEVWVRQGAVEARGGRLLYRNDTGVAHLEGPVALRREGEKPLSGEAQALRYELDEDRLWLLGVELRQGGRTTRAREALVVEREGVAYLLGGVESRDPQGFLRGERVLYLLKTGEAVVLGGVSGEFRE